jgi:DNA-directed RNA polymerase specialized sigma24 family protein
MKEGENSFWKAMALFRVVYFQVSDREVAKDIVQDVFMETWTCIAEGGEIQNHEL